MNPIGNSYDMLKIETTFAQDVSNALPAPGTTLNFANQLGVGVAIDSDGNPVTGNLLTCNSTSQLRPFEYQVDIGTPRLDDGNYSIFFKKQPIYSGPSNPGAEAVTLASKNTISMLINLNAVGVFDGQKVPKIGLQVNAFNGVDTTNTDCAPLSEGATIELFTS
ncbi:MAG: hypothetical protein M3N13_07855 [Candidatus Eremiobacteraeota bacterium]|nr:hypothetical protein [Candidatus Eremiobacteraeota bacterium]